jgi:hypothetical protein
MTRNEITQARLALPRLLNGVELAPENAPSMPLASVNFDLGAAVVKRNEFKNMTEIAVGLMLTGRDDTFACLFLDVPSARSLAKRILEVTT